MPKRGLLERSLVQCSRSSFSLWITFKWRPVVTPGPTSGPYGGRQHTKKDRNCLHLFVPAKNLFSADSVIINSTRYISFIECVGCEQWPLWYMAVGFFSVKISKINREGLIEPPGSCVPGVTSVRIKINISLPFRFEPTFQKPMNQLQSPCAVFVGNGVVGVTFECRRTIGCYINIF